jgi:hypothetical protein
MFAIRYLALTGSLNLIWEVVQIPLYTLSANPDKAAILYAIGHCTLGDVLIASCTLTLGLVSASRCHSWPTRYWVTCVVSISTGVAYTVLSEWYNTTVLRSWAYSDLMPQVWGIGISPVAQWVFVPALSFAILKSARRPKSFSE